MFTLKLAHAQEQMQYLCVKTLNVLKSKLSFILFPKQQKQQKTSTEFRFVLRSALSLCSLRRKYAAGRWKPQGTLTTAQSSVVFCSEMTALAWMEGYSAVCCQKLLYHSRAFCHRRCFKLSDCAGVCSAPYGLHYPHLSKEPETSIPLRRVERTAVEGQWKCRLCAHRSVV